MSERSKLRRFSPAISVGFAVRPVSLAFGHFAEAA